MSFIARHLTQTITVERWTGHNEDAEPTYSGTLVEMAARVRYGARKVVNLNGDEVIATTTVATEEEIGPYDRVWLPGADTGDADQAKTPIRTERASSLSTGDSHSHTYFG